MKNNIGIYIHIPYCKSKCSYCSFVSVCNFYKVGAYIKAIKKEIELFSKINNKVVDSIFIGGGTPSSIDEKYIVELISFIKINFIVINYC